LKEFDFGIRVDMGGIIGSGHIYRSSALADELIKNGKKVVFIVKNKRNFLLHTHGKKYHCIDLKTTNDNECIKKCQKLKGIKNLILDLQKHNEKYAKKLKNNFFIISIDDTGNKKIYSNIIINGQIGKFNYNYSFNDPSTKRLLGTDYIILRNSFHKLSKKFSISKKPIKRILLAFGGSDDEDVIRKILPFLISRNFHLTVILGATYPYSNVIFLLAKKHKNLQIKKSLNEVASIYLKNDIVIASSGMTSYELACLGVPSLFIPSGEHQHKIAKEFMKKGFGINYGFWDDDYDHFSKVLAKFSNHSFRKKMNRDGKKIVDGKAIFRIIKSLINLHSYGVS
jgi:UDP-2,4-diacetamido-2,4,6-trideoxy-beta-L-altropyranose hydrolase